MTSECFVCCTNYDNRSHTEVKCPSCEYSSCKQCVQTYIVSQTKDPHCMNCNVAFTTEFLYSKLNKTFMNVTLKEEQLKRLIEREKARLPESMNDVTAVKELENSVNWTELNALKHEAIKQSDVISKKREEYREITSKLLGEIRTLENEYYLIHNKIQTKENIISNARDIVFKNKKKTINNFKFIQPCPVNDCKGYLSKAWKCELCSTWACSKCLEIVGEAKDTPHECKKENIESAELIRKSTKPCPDCGTRIQKISGCPQMWCTQCQIAFNWNTGKRETGIIHNPHYFEFRRNGGQVNAPRNPGDVVCGGIPANEIADFLIFLYTEEARDLYKQISGIEEGAAHNTYILNRLRAKINEAIDHRYLRFQYLMKEVDDKQFRRKISIENTNRRKAHTQADIVELLQTVLIENLNSIVNVTTPKPIKNISKYTDDEIVRCYTYRPRTGYNLPGLRCNFVKSDYERFMKELGVFVKTCMQIREYANKQLKIFHNNTNLATLKFTHDSRPFALN